VNSRPRKKEIARDSLPLRKYLEHLAMFPLVTIDIVVVDDTPQFLLVKRNKNNATWKGEWATPGGRVFRNENLSHAAHRILKRETGIDVPLEDLELKGVGEAITPVEHAVTIVFTARTTRQEVIVDGTSSEAAWFSQRDAPRLRPVYAKALSLCGIELSKKTAESPAKKTSR